MLLVILGAGASHDSVLEPPPLAREFRPPLADGLFGHAEYMQRAFEQFENLGGMAAEVEMAVKASVGLEAVMDRYRDKATSGHWEAASRVWRQLVEMRYYLFAVIERSAGQWWDRNGRRTHLELLCTAIDRQIGASEEALFVTFNYDDLLERALKPLGQTYETLDGYVSRQFPLVKLHGSIGWGRAVNPSGVLADRTVANQVANGLANGKSVLTDLYDFWAGDRAGGKLWIPAIAIPLSTKDAFECPPTHVAAMKDRLPSVSRVLSIGWRGREDTFTEILADQLPAGVPWDIVGNTGARSVAEHLRDRRNIDADYRILNGGFTEFALRMGADGQLPEHSVFEALGIP